MTAVALWERPAFEWLPLEGAAEWLPLAFLALPLAFFQGPLPWVALAALTTACLWVDLHFFARGREPTFREGVIWSVGWLVFSLLAGVVVLLLSNVDDAVNYTTVYFVERSLSLDNLFVFLLLFSYFGIPDRWRAGLLFWGIAAALVLRGGAILGGVALIERFHFVIYVLGALLLVLAYRILRGVEENVDPDRNFVVRAVRRFFPVTGGHHGGRWFARIGGRLHATPIFLCLAAIVAADIAFAVDSIPAAFAITRDSVLIWMGNVFALLGLRALFVLVEGLIRRFRYLDQTIAAVLALVAVKLLIEDVYKVGPLTSLAVVAAAFAVGIVASLLADRRDPDAAAKREVRGQRTARTEAG
jgi:tellurite resistance protein TerC